MYQFTVKYSDHPLAIVFQKDWLYTIFLHVVNKINYKKNIHTYTNCFLALKSPTNEIRSYGIGRSLLRYHGACITYAGRLLRTEQSAGCVWCGQKSNDLLDTVAPDTTYAMQDSHGASTMPSQSAMITYANSHITNIQGVASTYVLTIVIVYLKTLFLNGWIFGCKLISLNWM